MSTDNQALIDTLIQEIDTAVKEGSVTNEMVAAILSFLNTRYKNVPELSSRLTTEIADRKKTNKVLENLISDLTPAMIIPDFWGMLWRSGDEYEDTALQIDTTAGKVRLMSKVLWYASQKGRHDWGIAGNINTLFETDWVLPEGETVPNKGQAHYIVMDWTETKAYGIQFMQLEPFVTARAGHKLVLLAAGPLGNGYGKSFTTFGPIVLDGILYTPTGSEPLSLRQAGVVKGDGLEVSMDADSGTISYTAIKSDGSTSSRSVALPTANGDKAGLMSPQHVAEISTLKTQRLYGHRLVILGDSLSAYRGWIPEGNATWYDGRGDGVNWQDNDVSSVTDMWWYKLCKRLGCTLLINESYSGSTIANMRGTADTSQSSFVTRCARSIGADATLSPKGDLIIIQGGLNDTWGGTAHGTPNYTGNFSESELNNVLPAFCNVLYNVMLYNPGARILFLIDDAVNSSLKESMRDVCHHMGIPYVDIVAAPKINGHYSKAGHDFVCSNAEEAINAMYN